jgi:NADH-quinone oxidoreductase subunit N
VVAASVDAHSYALAVIAMVTAAVAAFFYLRVAVTMYSPVGPVADGSSAADGSEGATPAAEVGADPASEPAGLSVLTEAPPTDAVDDRVVRVPALTWLAIGICVTFTVVFGIIPGPIVDFAHQATLLFA